MATGSFIGVGNFKGYWDATDNSGSADYLNTGMPLLATSASNLAGYSASVDPAQVASVGDYWQVNVAGSTEVDAESNWALNDWVVYQGDETVSPTRYTWNRLSVTDTIAATVIGDASQSGLKNTLLASASANSGPHDGSNPVGQFGEVLFCSASNADGTGTNKYFEGNSNFTFDPEVQLLNLTGTLRVLGEIQATQLHTNYVTSSVLYDSGDTKFGDSAGDQHQFTGSITCTIGITSSTNVQAAYFEGDGSRLTGISAGSSLGNPVYVNAASSSVPFWGAVDGGGDFGLTGSGRFNFYSGSNSLQVTGNVRATDLYVGSSIYHELAENTRLFVSDDEWMLFAGGTRLQTWQTYYAQDSVVINPGNNDVDFVVETENSASTLWVDGATDNVGIRCAPSGTIQALTVSGSTLFGSASANSHEFIGSIYADQHIVHLNDADTKITFTNDQIDFAAGGVTLLTLDEDGQDLVTIGDGTDVDLKVRTLTDDFTIFVEGSSDNVGIGTWSPAQKLSVSGSTVFGTKGGTDSHWFSGSVYVTNDVHIYDKLYSHLDTDTYINFGEGDQLKLAAGGATMVHLYERPSEDYLQLGSAAGGTDDVDVRMGGGGYDNTLWVDGGSHNVGIRCAPSGTIEALTVSGSTLFGSASANTHQFTGSIYTDSSIYFTTDLKRAGDDDTYINFTDDRLRFYVGNVVMLDLTETTRDTIKLGDGSDIDTIVQTDNSDRTLWIDGGNDNVGIGCAPSGSGNGFTLSVSGSVKLGDTIATYNAMTGTFELTGNLGINTPATTYSLALPNVDSLVGRGMAYAWSTYSSARYKDNVATMSNPIETAKKLRGVEFTWKNSGNKDFGFIAEEVGKVLPQLVAYENDGHTATGMDYSKITSLLIECVKSQQDQIETQEERIKYLEKKFKP